MIRHQSNRLALHPVKQAEIIFLSLVHFATFFYRKKEGEKVSGGGAGEKTNVFRSTCEDSTVR